MVQILGALESPSGIPDAGFSRLPGRRAARIRGFPRPLAAISQIAIRRNVDLASGQMGLQVRSPLPGRDGVAHHLPEVFLRIGAASYDARRRRAVFSAGAASVCATAAGRIRMRDDHTEKQADHKPAPKPSKPDPADAPEPDPEPEPKDSGGNGNGHASALQERIEALIRAGLAAGSLDRPCTLVPCNLGTPAYTFTGRRHPITGAFEPTEFAEAYKGGNIIILDEVDKLDPSTAAAVNASLANGHLATPDGPIVRGAGTVVIATANTWGNGADRQYCGSNQLDAATLDRFAGGRLEADYDPDYEAQYDPEVVAYCQKVREHIKARHLRRICSTRMIQACAKLKAAGLDWQAQVTADWSAQEREGLQ